MSGYGQERSSGEEESASGEEYSQYSSEKATKGLIFAETYANIDDNKYMVDLNLGLSQIGADAVAAENKFEDSKQGTSSIYDSDTEEDEYEYKTSSASESIEQRTADLKVKPEPIGAGSS